MAEKEIEITDNIATESKAKATERGAADQMEMESKDKVSEEKEITDKVATESKAMVIKGQVVDTVVMETKHKVAAKKERKVEMTG